MTRKYANLQVESVLEEIRAGGCVITEPVAVHDYLLRYPILLDILPSVFCQVQSRFGHRAQVSLDRRTEPEENQDYLALYVRQEQYQEDILDILDSVFDEFSTELGRSSGEILITTDFRQPGR